MFNGESEIKNAGFGESIDKEPKSHVRYYQYTYICKSL